MGRIGSRHGRRGGGVRFLTVLSLVACALPAAAQDETIPADRTFSGQAQVTAVDLIVDVRDEGGRVPADLRPEDFVVLEDGAEKRVVAVEAFAAGAAAPSALERPASRVPAAEETAWTWRTVLYVDQVLASSGSIRRAAQTLAQQAGDLTRLGTVEIVAADPDPRLVLAETRSARLVEQTLLDVAREVAGRDAVGRLRKKFVDELRMDLETSGTGQGSDRGIAGLGKKTLTINRRNHVWSTVVQEDRLLREQQDRLLTWTANDLERGPRALLLVNDGYDLDPRDFYMQGVEDMRMRSEIDSLLQTYSPMARFRGMVKVLAADGWVCVNLALGSPSSTFATVGAEISGKGFMGDVAGRTTQGQQGVSLPSQLFYRPLDGLRNLAAETGGELVTGKGGIPQAVGRLAERVRVTYQVERLPDGEVHRVEVRSRRPGLTVKAPEWSGSPAPEAVSSARARRLLEDAAEAGDLPVVAAVGIEKEDGALTGRDRGTLQARVDLSGFAAAALPERTALRITFAVELTEQLPYVRSDVVQGQDLRDVAAWVYTLPVSLPPEAGKVAVLVEELSSGAWGGAVAARVTGPLPEVPEGRHVAAVTGDAAAGAAGRSGESKVVEGYDLPVDLLPAAKALVLVPPAGEVLTGGTKFEMLVTRPDVDRVEVLVDGERAATARRAPFSARVDLGELPRPRTVEAVAYDAQGTELGRDSVIVNEGAGGTFRVRLIEPRRADQVGPVDVEAEVRVPPGSQLDRVEIAWNDEPVATLYEPPFRQRVRVPPESPVGFVTVTAHLADGTTAEDLIFMNGPGGDERVEVRLVELYTVVTDPDGRPIRGLTAADFQVVEEGRRQKVEALNDGSDLPLSLGLLLDSSASMADVMRDVQIAAVDFLFLTLSGEDRAFLVDFDSEPRLVQPLTGDLQAVGRKIVRLQPGGYTALCDALVFSLVQMQSVRGRRALVVLSDGVGREERVGYATCLRLAQQVGVPIYAIVLDRDGDERDRSGRVESVATAVGGRVFYVESLENLGSVYRAIRGELDSQYVVTYYPSEEPDDDDFRHVEVGVPQPGLTARTVSGYWP
jgi:Ca-activated chloride channel homolog